MAYKTVESWIGDMIAETDRKCRAIQCVRLQPAGGTADVHTVQLTGMTWTADRVYRTLKGRAEHEVQDKPGRHNFEMRAFFDTNESHSEHASFIVEDGELKPTGSKTISEGSSVQGILGQHMRHTENMHVIVKTLAEGIAVQSVLREERWEKREDAMRKELNDAYAIVREASFRQTQQEHAMIMEKLKYERDTKQQELMVKMAPNLLSAVTGQEIANPIGDAEILDKAADAIDDDKLMALVAGGMIPQEFASMLAMRFKQTRDRKAKEAEALKKVPAGETGDVSNVLPMLRAKSDGTDDE